VWNPSRDEWLPSYWVIHLDCVVIEQEPAPTIIPISEGVLAAFHAPKRGNRDPAQDEQSDCCSIEWSRRHRAQITDYHGSLGGDFGLVTLNATSESLSYVAAIGCREQIAFGHVLDSTPPVFLA
jgi:hypothetical protein